MLIFRVLVQRTQYIRWILMEGSAIMLIGFFRLYFGVISSLFGHCCYFAVILSKCGRNLVEIWSNVGRNLVGISSTFCQHLSTIQILQSRRAMFLPKLKKMIHFRDSVTKSGPPECVIRFVSSRQYVSFFYEPKWIEDWPSRQQIIRKRLIIDRFSVYI